MAEEAPSIRRRLSRALVFISLVWGVAVAIVVSGVIEHEVDEIMDDTLRESAQILHPLLSANALQLPLGSGRALPATPHREEVVWQIVDSRQGVLLRSHDAPPQALTDVQQRDIVTAPNGWRVLVTPFDEPGRVLMVAQVGVERREAKVDAIQYTVGAALLVGLLCAAWLRARVRSELLPLSALTDAVAKFDPLQPGATLAGVDRLELGPVRDAIATLGGRLAARVAHERAFAAHAAHALRTPLAGMMVQLATAQQASPPEAQPMLALAREAADRLRRVVSAVLTLFRTGNEMKWQPVDLAALLAQLHVDGLAVRVGAPARLVADPDLLSAALANLLDNAARQGATHLQVQVRPQAGGVCIVMTDDGPGVSEEERQLLQRLLIARTYDPPVGMGLMLADWVARAHGGALNLTPVAVGFCVELSIGPRPG